MKTLLIVIASLAMGALWVAGKFEHNALRAELDAAQQSNSELESARRENQALRTRQPEAREVTRMQAEADARVRRETAATQQRLAPALVVGEWAPPSTWQNRGSATPAASVETLLWAAAGGDLGKLSELLQLDEAGAAKAAQLLAGAPANFRASYATPQQFIAAFTAKAITLGDAQLVWQQQNGPDDAIACVWLKDPAPDPARGESPENPADPNAPPMQPANRKTKTALMNLRRTDEGWKIVVPAGAVDRLARDLGGAR
jgi:hypothetical protein